MNTRYSTFVEYGFTTLYTPNHGICHNICGTLNISFVVDRVSDVSKRHHNAGKHPKYARIHLHSRITAVHTSSRIKILLRENREAGLKEALQVSTAPTGGRTPSTRDTHGIPPPPHASGIVPEGFLSLPANHSPCGSFGHRRSHGHTNLR